MDAVTAAFTRFFDYAGLFPPAGLAMDEVMARYGAYRGGPHAWMLGRVIVPADRLDEAQAAARAAGATAGSPWPASVLVGDAGSGRDVARDVLALSRPGSALIVEAVEAAAATADEIVELASIWPSDVERFVEIPADGETDALLRALKASGQAGKIRAGGVTEDKFPATLDIARVLTRAARDGVAVKATAGLHHAIRGRYRLTYEAQSPSGIMHGFVNLVLAATLLLAGRIDEDLADACLDDDRPEVFKLSGRAGSWLNGVVTYGEISDARRALLRSVGTCSFEEPVAEIEALDFGLKGVDRYTI
jgi:hypothetical protein